jgi:hypothetical protein
MSATDRPDGINGDHHRQTPARGDNDPATTLALGFVEQHIGHDAVAEKDEQRGADKFRQVGIHWVFSIRSRGWI